MRFPGFTAETSLYKTTQHYQAAGALAQAHGALYPAQAPPGCRLVAGWRQEERFLACLDRCHAGGGTHTACWRTCCREVTGSYCCYIA